MEVVAERNLRMEDASATRPPRRSAPQSPAAGMAALTKAAPNANVTPDGAAFWFSNGLVHVE